MRNRWQILSVSLPDLLRHGIVGEGGGGVYFSFSMEQITLPDLKASTLKDDSSWLVGIIEMELHSSV